MTLKYNNVYFYLLFAQIILLFLMPPLTELGSTEAIITYGIFGIISVFVVLLFFFKEKQQFNMVSTFVYSFFAICTIAGVWGILTGNTTVPDAVRGVIPFAWYIYVLFLYRLDDDSLKKLVRTIGIVSILFSLRIIVYYFYYVFGEEGLRVTFFLANATAMITMVGHTIFVNDFLLAQKKFISIVGAIITFFAIGITATKAMLLATILGDVLIICFHLLKNKLYKLDLKKYITRVLSLLIVLVITLGVVFLDGDIGRRWGIGFDALSSLSGDIIDKHHTDNLGEDGDTGQIDPENNDDNSQDITNDGSVYPRFYEYQAAYENWKESPLLGKGLGFRWNATDDEQGVIFVHNLIMFFLMDTGLLGITFIVALIVAILCMLVKYMKNGYKVNIDLFFLSFSCIIMAFVYGNLFAVFRNIEFTIICGVFVSIMIKCIKKKDFNEDF